MAKQSLNTIKNWFKTGLKPTQQQFLDAWDSFWHKDDIIPAGSIENLNIHFDEKADSEALHSHVQDLTAHGVQQKAGLREKNIFSAENIFRKNIRTGKVKTDTGIDFNLDLNDKASSKGFTERLIYNIENGSLFLNTTPPDQSAEQPDRYLYTGTQLTLNNPGDMDISGSLSANALKMNTGNDLHQVIRPAATITADTEFVLPKLNGILAKTEDLPAITAGENISLTGIYPHIKVNVKTTGTSSPLINVTYEELNSIIEVRALVPGQKYLITDFQSTMVYGNLSTDPGVTLESITIGSEVYSGDIEPLIVTAITTGSLDQIALSTIYPDDELYYTIQNLVNGILASTKGTILKRTDHTLNNTANFDYRITMYTTNRKDPRKALNLISDCTIYTSGPYGSVMPVVIGSMKNSTINTNMGDIMAVLYDSRLEMNYGFIQSHTAEVYSCEIKGEVLYVRRNYEGKRFVLQGIFAEAVSPNSPLLHETVFAKLANKTVATYITEGGDKDHGLFQLNYGPEGVSSTKLSKI